MQWPLSVDHGRQLALDHLLGLAGLALGQRLADADDGRDAAAPAPPCAFSATSASRFAVVLAALGMADDGVAHAELVQHRRRHFAGVGALLVLPTRPARPARASSRPAAICSCARYGAGTQTATSQAACSCPATSARTSASLAARLPFIFQLPAISLLLRHVFRSSTRSARSCRCAGSIPSARAPRRPRPPGRCCGSRA